MTTKVSHGTPINMNAPRRFLRRGGTGTTMAAASAIIAQRADMTRSLTTSQPRTIENPIAHAKIATSLTRLTADTIHAERRSADSASGIHRAHARRRGTAGDGRWTVAVTLDHRSAPFHCGFSHQRDPVSVASMATL